MGAWAPATFDQVAANKLSVRINLKKPEGVALAKRLVAVSDVAAESFRPGVMERLGLGFEALREAKPDIIMLSVSSSGQSGPDSHFAGYAPLFGAWGGLGGMSGYADGPPVEMRHVMDHTVGMNAAVAVVAALHRRRATGEGGLVDVSAREVASSLIGEALLLAAAGAEPQRIGNDHARMAPHGVYPAAGRGPLALDRRRDRRRMASAGRLMGGPNSRAIRALRRPATGMRTGPSWTRSSRLDGHADADAAAATLQARRHRRPCLLDHAARSPPIRICVRARPSSMWPEPDGKARAAVGVPMRLSKGADIGIARGTPKLGEHEDYVYGELLGMTRPSGRRWRTTEVIY